jgi:Uma2 family endonuclease
MGISDMASTTSKIVTYEEWLGMPEVEGKEEVVDGEILIMPPNKWSHQEIVAELHAILLAQFDRKAVRVAASVFGIVIRKDPFTLRSPDLAVFIRKNIVEMDGYIYSPPELVVEVLSPRNSRKDMVRKTEDYQNIGVPELWLLSPEARTVEVLQLQDGLLHRTQILAEGQLHPLRFPETVVDVASVWPD